MVVLVAATVGVAVTAWWGRAGGSGFTDHWGDADVAALVRDVERLRGLRFSRPVRVELLNRSQLAQARAALQRSAAADAGRLGRQHQLAVVLGLDSAPPEEGTVTGWYDPAQRRVVILGDDVHDGAVRFRLVEGLTAALLHQRFRVAADPLDIEAGLGSDRRKSVLAAGDARRVAVDDAAGRAGNGDLLPTGSWDSTSPSGGSGGLGGSGGAAIVELGEAAARAALAWGGQPALDKALAGPDDGGLAAFDPLAAAPLPAGAGPSPKSGPLPAPPPVSLGRDEVIVSRGALGPATWLEVIATRANPDAALRAVFGWAGDAYTLRAGPQRACLQAVLATASTADSTELHEALAAWVADAPAFEGSQRSVVQDGSHVNVEACAPLQSLPSVPSPAAAAAGPSAPRRADQAILWAPVWVNRLAVLAAAMEPRLSPALVRCAAVEAVAPLPLRRLADEVGPRGDLQRRFAAALAPCASAISAAP